jgi:molybdopterin converting factor small subunit
MAVQVSIPTILRTYTDGAKAVNGSGGTLDEVFTDLDRQYPGLRDRIVDADKVKKFVNIYLNDEDIRFTGGLTTTVADGDSITVLPAVAGG